MKIQSLFFSLFCAAAMLSSCSGSKYNYETVENDPLNAKIYTLPNGLKVYMTVNKEQPRIQADIAVRTGGKNDPAETTGLAHYLEHLMFKGTTHFGTIDYEAEKPLLDEITNLYEVYRTKTDEAERKAIYHQIDSISGVAAQYAIPNEYDKLMATIGADGTNAFTSEDVTCYVEDIPSNQIENWAKIQSERFKNPVFRLFHTELEAVYEEKNMAMTKDIRKVLEAINQNLFPNHPYGKQTVIGTQEHLKNPSLVNIRNYFDTWYVPNNVAICLSGDFDPDQMVDIISKYFGDWKASDGVPQYEWPEESPIIEPIYQEVLGNEAEMVCLAWRFKGAIDEDSEMMAFVDNLLNNGTAGLLDLDLVNTQKVKVAQSFLDAMADYSSYLVLGMPMPGQTLEEVKDLLLAEVNKLRCGQFDDELIESVITDLKLSQQKRLEENSSRVRMFEDAFINGDTWQHSVSKMSRYEKIRKQDVIDFVNKYLNDDNFVCVYKRQGTDPNIKRIEKPAITPINANRDAVSPYLQSIIDSKVTPIEPVFVDYEKDLEQLTLEHNLPLIYRKNETNQTFELFYVFEMGTYADPELTILSQYASYLGTDEMSAEEMQKALYKLGCNTNFTCSNRRFYARISGLNENLEAAVELLDKAMNHIQPDEQVYQSLIETIKQSRAERKANQNAIEQALRTYAYLGGEAIKEYTLDEAEMRTIKPSDLTDKLHNLSNLKHRVFYYGPSSSKEVADIINAKHQTAETLADVTPNKKYQKLATTENVVYFVPYTANNSILSKYTRMEQGLNKEIEPARTLFNEYFGGSMNGIVFQEMRETRGLAYNAWAYYYGLGYKDDNYSFMAQITTQNDKLQEAYNHFEEIIEDTPKSEAAFQNAINGYIARMRTQRTTRSSIIWSYIDAQDLEWNEDPNKYKYEHVQGLTLDDVMNFQQQYLKGKKYSVTLVGDPQQVDMKFFESIGQVKKPTLEEVFGF